jgi:NAD(P)-dependent dehydrogenase (short-subunit alcohol dehydrogenase family)
MFELRHDTPLRATVAALVDQVKGTGKTPPLDPSERLDGKVVMITGANSGLGKAVAIHLASLGAEVIMACRSGIPAAGEDVKRASGSKKVSMVRVELDDLASVHRLADELRDRGVRLDRLVINAGVVPREARKTKQGFELMFGVNFLANVALVDRLLGDGVLPRKQGPGGDIPRLVIVSSEAHRSVPPLDFDRLGDYVHYGVAGGLGQYGHTKLCLCTYATELSRRLKDGDDVEVSVHALCPGAVNTNMAREAPWWLKPVLGPVMHFFFRPPAIAAEPVLHLVASKRIEGETGHYMHMMRKRDPVAHALDPECGRRLWEKSHELTARHAPASK